MAFIRAVAVCSPEHRYPQEELAEAVGACFGSGAGARRIFQNAGIRSRRLAQPIQWHLKPKSFQEKNDDAVVKACELSNGALSALAAQAGFSLDDLDHLVTVNSTALATPTLDALLIHRMGLRPTIGRTPLFGLGCLGGAAGLSLAARLADARPQERVALVCVELCGHTFNPADQSAKNVVAAGLFADGAAAVLLSGRQGPGARLEIIRSGSMTFPDSIGVMGWHFSELGLGLVLARDLPDVVRRHLAPALSSFLTGAGVRFDEIKHFIVHPGGPKVIDAVRDSLHLSEEHLRASRRHLEECGNLSSASVLFVLRDVLEQTAVRPGELGLLFALGPGFSAEFLLLKFL
ncbi:MAG: type III polyketide synthase [Elusimicrobia bacterium]|nr:type III polyketide synthase [Elusimicrobiota bacterium]